MPVRQETQQPSTTETTMDSTNLIEHIITGNFVSANELLEQKMLEIQEKKLYEKKRMIQAEAFGGLTKDEIESRKKAGYKKAADVLGDPSRHKMKPLVKLKKRIVKVVKEDSLDEIKLPGDVAGSFMRNVAARGLKLGRKYLGKDFTSRYMKSRTDQMRDTSPEQPVSQDTSSDTDPKKKKGGIVAAGKAALGSLASQYGG